MTNSKGRRLNWSDLAENYESRVLYLKGKQAKQAKKAKTTGGSCSMIAAADAGSESRGEVMTMIGARVSCGK